MPLPYNPTPVANDNPEYLKLARWTTYSMLGLLGIEVFRFMRDVMKKTRSG